MLRPELVDAVKAAIRSAVAPTEIDSITLVEGQNYRAEEVLFTTGDLTAGTGPLSAPNHMEMLRSVGHILLQAGEERTPFRTIRGDDEEPLKTALAFVAERAQSRSATHAGRSIGGSAALTHLGSE